jgi:nitrite reductase/ring-hydroxylating ferredoxin subunit
VANTAGEAAGADERKPAAPVCLLLTGDLPLRGRLRRLAADHGLVVAEADGEPGTGEPAVAVIDLDLPGAPGQVRQWRARWPAALLAGYLGVPDAGRWVAAQRAGCDLVSNRGALVPRLRALLARGAPTGRVFPLFDAADAAGRLGLVFRTGDSPAGPVAVYRADGALCAIADRCPHAGAALSGGEPDGAVITCPGHGSRFDIRTGERLRGPADADIAVFPLTGEGGQVCLVVRAQAPGSQTGQPDQGR